MIKSISKSTSEKIINTKTIPTAECAIQQLIENSIDANSRTIEIRLLNTRSFSIRDDGVGIEEIERVATERYTTSSTSTCGFRGQSLLSLAALCTMKIVTKRKGDDEAISKRIHQGQLTSQGSDRRISRTGQGTTVTIHELFANVSVRFKILQQRNMTTFLERVRVLIKDYALCHPTIRFELFGSTRSRSCSTTQLEIRAHDAIRSRLLHFGLIETYDKHVEIREYVSIAQHFRVRGLFSREQKWNGTSSIKFYVNGRIIQRCYNLNRTVRRAYGQFSTSKIGPLVILDIMCDNMALMLGSQRSQIDKCDIFLSALMTFIRSLFPRRGRPIHDDRDVQQNEIKQDIRDLMQHKIQRPKLTTTTLRERRSVRDIAKDWTNPCLERKAEKRVTHDPSKENVAKIRLSTDMLQSAKVVSCVSRKFFLATCNVPESKRKLLLCFDQHAVHERIRYERLQANMHSRLCQGHLEYHNWAFPQHKIVSVEIERKVKECSTFLLRWGFRYTIFNVPSHPDRRKITMTRSCKILRVCLNLDHMIEFVDHCTTRRIVSSSNSMNVLPPTVTRLLASKACRGAIMFGDEVTSCQARGLISQLAKCRLPFQCAHGRPSVQVLSAFRRNGLDVGMDVAAKRRRRRRRRVMKTGSILGSLSIAGVQV